MTHHDVSDRIAGILLGLAAGDRNGGPVRMALRVAESLTESRRFDADDVAGRYLAWYRRGAFDTGPVAARVLALVDGGLPWAEATLQVHHETGGLTAGCNPAHRSPPLAMAAFLRDEDLAAAAVREASLTHYDPLAGEVAAATVLLCRALVRGEAWTAALRRAGRGRRRETLPALQDASTAAPRQGGYAPHALHAAVWFVGRSQGFSEALEKALAFAGPANYCPVLVGALGGARWGAASIPGGLLGHCGVLPGVREAASALARDW